MSGPLAERIEGSTLARALRDLVWSDIRNGLPRLRDLGSAPRVLGVLGIIVIVAAALQLLLVDVLRANSALVGGYADIGDRPQLVPVPLVPLALATFAIGWSFLLTGASRAHPVVMGAVVALFTATTLVWITGSDPTASTAQRMPALIGVGVAVLLTLAGRRLPGVWRLLQFVVLLTGVTVAYAATATGGAPQLDLLRVESAVVTLGLVFSLARGLATPLLVVLGFGLAVFTYRVARWVGDAAHSARHSWTQPALLGLLVAGGCAVSVRTVASSWSSTGAGSWAGALLFVVLPLVLGAVALRRAHDRTAVDEAAVANAAEKIIPTVALALFATMVLVSMALLVASAAGAVVQLAGGLGLSPAADATLLRTIDRATASTDLYRAAFCGAALVAGFAIARRRPTLGLYLVVLGTAHGWVALTTDGPLGMLHFTDTSQVAAWLVVAVVAALAVDAARDTLDRARQRNYTVSLVIVLLFGQVALLENPFHPILPISGAVAVTAALALDTLTLGAWANTGSTAFPRASRLPLYVGYALFTLTLITWAAGTHDFTQFNLFTGQAGAGGLRVFGDPLLLTLVALLVLRRRSGQGAAP
jgi:hypothetical protein